LILLIAPGLMAAFMFGYPVHDIKQNEFLCHCFAA